VVGDAASATWQVTLCDLMWHAGSRSTAEFLAQTAVRFLSIFYTNVPCNQPSLSVFGRQTATILCSVNTGVLTQALTSLMKSVLHLPTSQLSTLTIDRMQIPQS